MAAYFALQTPYITTWGNPTNWPKTHIYIPNQGIHPPGPVYQNNTLPQSGPWNGYGQPFYGQPGYPMNPFQPQAPYCTGAPYCIGPCCSQYAPGMMNFAMPQPMCPAAMTSQAAAAAAANAQLAQMPNGPSYFVGATPAEIQAQQAMYAAQMGMVGGAPQSLAPFKPSDAQQFWCKELDGGWTLRTYSDIALGDVSPGHWERHAVSGYFFWVRQAG